MSENILCKLFGISLSTCERLADAELRLKEHFHQLDAIKEANQYKVIRAMQASNLNYTNFYWNTGYGYNDPGREKVEEIFARVFHTEDALVRPNIVSGTHALYLTLSGLLSPGDEVISISGTPYDTLLTVLGVQGQEANNLISMGIHYQEVDLVNQEDFDLYRIFNTISAKTKMIMIQRSTGYSQRKAITIDKIKMVIDAIRTNWPNLIIMVDNCYGEFLELLEPSDVGADVCVGSLIKNPGGGIALTGGYICGKSLYIKAIANRLTAPGIGKEVGLTFGQTRNTLQGLYLAPGIVSEAIKGALLVGTVFSDLGYQIIPEINDARSDIIQSIVFNDKNLLIKFCQAVQQASPVDAMAVPEPWAMPGYQHEVIMASGAFVQGSSIELSADAPIREPYTAYYQGGLSYGQCKLAAAMAIEKVLKS